LKLFGGWEIQRAFQQAITSKIWTFIVGVMVNKGISFEGMAGNTKNFFKYFSRKQKKIVPY
jgi:hypothetical protein